MKPKIIDISASIKEGMPIWPNSTGIHFKGTQLTTDLHAGTHIDAPSHFISNGKSLDKIPLEKLIGPALVIHLPKIKAITTEDLTNLNLPKKTKRLLFRTSNSNFWERGEKKFQKDFVGLTADAATWLVKRGIQLVGIDYLSIGQYEKAPQVHQTLLENGVVILEGLNLSDVLPGLYQLICLPLKLINTEAAPARAVLLSL